MDSLVDGCHADRTIAARRHSLDVASGAKTLARAGKHDASDVGFKSRHRELARERMIYRARHGVASHRAIQGKRKHALIERGEEIRCTSVQGGDRHQCFPLHVAQTKVIQLAVFHTSRSTRALAELAMTQRIPFLGWRRRRL